MICSERIRFFGTFSNFFGLILASNGLLAHSIFTFLIVAILRIITLFLIFFRFPFVRLKYWPGW